jgi:hypothetical protein
MLTGSGLSPVAMVVVVLVVILLAAVVPVFQWKSLDRDLRALAERLGGQLDVYGNPYVLFMGFTNVAELTCEPEGASVQVTARWSGVGRARKRELAIETEYVHGAGPSFRLRPTLGVTRLVSGSRGISLGINTDFDTRYTLEGDDPEGLGRLFTKEIQREFLELTHSRVGLVQGSLESDGRLIRFPVNFLRDPVRLEEAIRLVGRLATI